MIRVLDKKTSDKIAAGEVIERPVSIVKELVENSIDAGASSVTVEIKDGGKSYIRVTDDGCGIPADEAETAFLRHATSKIEKVSDLDSIEGIQRRSSCQHSGRYENGAYNENEGQQRRKKTRHSRRRRYNI